MLVRAAGRRTRRHTSLQLTQLADSLHLPFLCPAQQRWNTTHPNQAATSRASTRLQSQLEKTQTRRLATAAEQYSVTPDSSRYQFDKQGAQNVRWNYAGSEPFALKAQDDLILLQHSTTQPEYVSRLKHGIGGSSSDLVQNLHTCLRVERFERAKVVIHRLAEQCHPQSFEMQHVHRIFLEALFQHFQASPRSREAKQLTYEQIRDWFEDEVVEKQVPFDSSVLVLMMRTAINALTGAKLERAVRRYAELAHLSGDHWLDEIRDAEEFSDSEFMTLGAILPSLNISTARQTPPETDAVRQDTPPVKEPASNEHVMESLTDLPAVLEVNQKGMGLSSLKQALELAAPALDPDVYDDPTKTHLSPVERQRILEESASQAAIMRWKYEAEHLNKLGIHTSLEAKPLGALMWQWYSALLPLLREELKECRKLLVVNPGAKSYIDDRLVYGVHLESVPLEQIAATTIIFVMSGIASGKDKYSDSYTSDMRLGRLTSQLGKAIEAESNAEAAKKRAAAERRSKLGRPTPTPKKAAANPLYDFENLTWPSDVRVKLGAMLVSKLIETAKFPVTRQHPRTKEMVTQLQPAFQHKTLYELGRKQGWLVASPDLIQKLHREPTANLLAKRLPMVIEPEPWTNFTKGGYLNYATPVIRFAGADTVPRDYAYAAIQRGDLDQIFTALNALGKVPWKINDDVLRVQIDAWNSGESIANFAPLNPKVDVPPEPLDKSDTVARRKWLMSVKQAENLRSGFHSQRCFQNFQLEIARSFRREKMYFPHNIDFRGRAYPVPPYLNHMGADNARALMKFANGKELGVDGLRWLKIHLANVYGYDKASLQEREQFSMEHLSDIYDSATNPLTGNRWWLQSEDAWQTLAACFELKAALDSPDPTKYVSNLPVHQDGTCNGLQHYAALGGDAIGARQVNLEPGDRPSDVYTAVAEAVKAEVERDNEAGHPVAKLLHGKISRKVVKQPVMTNVYGVTYYGAREQVKKQLEEIFPNIRRGDAVDHLTLASYVAKKIFKSLGEMFKGAQSIQQWLGDCADRISTSVTPEQIFVLQSDVNGKPVVDTPAKPLTKEAKPLTKQAREEAKEAKREKKKRDKALRDAKRQPSASKQMFRSSVIWTTPLRLPVVQPYRSSKRRLVSTNLQKIALQEPSTTDPVSKRKQLQGFPPNFIHSLDATHMMLSAIKCSENDIAFASIHDSFWTHACDITELSVVLRDAFVAMHTEDVVGRLRQEFLARYKDCMYLASVNLTTEVGKKIHQFQKSKPQRKAAEGKILQPALMDELLIEVERVRLLNSEDAEERKRGEEMVTASSIFSAEANAEDALTVPTEIQDALLGGIPEHAEVAKGEDATAAVFKEPVLHDHEEVEEEEGNESLEDTKDMQETVPSLGDLKKKTVAPRKAIVRKVYVWLPLTFPPVPEKGDFDVKRLKESQYFFH